MVSRTHFLKGALSDRRQFLATESSLKMIKNALYFTTKALLALFKDITFWSCRKTA